MRLATFIGTFIGAAGLAVMAGCSGAQRTEAPGREGVVKYARFQAGGKTSYGLVEGSRIRRIAGDPFGGWRPTDETFALADVKLLVPTVPSKVLAMAGNYRSHLGDQPVPQNPEVFFKVPSCLIAQDEPIVIPPGTADVHYEAELVIVIGRRARNVPLERARDYVLGVTCGNDVSARDWQKNDRQWWRAKGSDTFGPCGPFIVAGLDDADLRLVLRVNGEIKQDARTRELIHDLPAMVSFISRYVTLEPGDLIYTGTSGTTSALKPGDVVEVEIEGIGTLRNPVRATAGGG
jgi:2-keto-4-pentenoate hydratase/2-oxohepta-3-ene-1,7-dioic acid hydratase in catechol pathway